MLPAKQTDFIFGVAGEEWGLVGCLVIVALLMALIIRIYYIAFHAPSQISSLICVGIGSMLLFQTFENIFMCLGIGPDELSGDWHCCRHFSAQQTAQTARSGRRGGACRGDREAGAALVCR